MVVAGALVRALGPDGHEGPVGAVEDEEVLVVAIVDSPGKVDDDVRGCTLPLVLPVTRRGRSGKDRGESRPERAGLAQEAEIGRVRAVDRRLVVQAIAEKTIAGQVVEVPDARPEEPEVPPSMPALRSPTPTSTFRMSRLGIGWHWHLASARHRVAMS